MTERPSHYFPKQLWTVTSPDMVPSQTDFSFFHFFIEKRVRNNIRILSRIGPPNFGNKDHTKKQNIFFKLETCHAGDLSKTLGPKGTSLTITPIPMSPIDLLTTFRKFKNFTSTKSLPNSFTNSIFFINLHLRHRKMKSIFKMPQVIDFIFFVGFQKMFFFSRKKFQVMKLWDSICNHRFLSQITHKITTFSYP